MAQVELVHVHKIYADGTPAVSDLNLSLAPGELLCVLGPSGCGKSSTLRMIAGLEAVSRGEVRIDGRNVVHTPPRERDIAMVFENYALYPHLNVYHNIAMPLSARGRPKAEIRERVQAIAETLGIVPQLQSRTRHLSGGQRQRVALARAMIRRPRMFLMDEPLGHLEAYMRVELRREIRRLHEAFEGTTFYITHDQEEAAAISDRIAVMSEGRLQQVGTILELIEEPANRFVAEFIGEVPINMFDGVLDDQRVLRFGGIRVDIPEAITARAPRPIEPGAVSVGIRPEHVLVRDGGDAVDGMPAKVELVHPMGDYTVLICQSGDGAVSAVVPSSEAPAAADNVKLVPQEGYLHAFDAQGDNLLYGTHRHG